MQEHGGAEDAEEDVYFPLNILESWRHEVAECEVEGPVGRGGERDGFAADAEGKEFGWIAGFFSTYVLNETG